MGKKDGIGLIFIRFDYGRFRAKKTAHCFLELLYMFLVMQN